MDAPAVQTRYQGGQGLLIGHGSLWVLMAAPDDERAVEEIWGLVVQGGSEAPVRVLEVAASAYTRALPGLAMVDVERPSALLTRGTGRVHLDGATFVLTLDGGTRVPDLSSGRVLLGGVVEAGAARVAPSPRTDAGPGTGASLIDGIPAAILAARGPDGPPPPRPRRAVLPDPEPEPVAVQEPAPEEPEADVAADPYAGDPLGQASSVGGDSPAATAYDDLPAGTPDAEPLPADVPETTTTRLARLQAEAEAARAAAPATTGPRGGDLPDAEPYGSTGPADPQSWPGVPDAGQPAPAAPPGYASTAGPADDDHDGSTVHRPHHLTSEELPTVYAVSCPLGHLTSPALPGCRICGQRIAPQEPRPVTRPPLGGLRLPTGEVVPLDRGVVIGRRPGPVPGAKDWPHLVHLPSTHAFVSRMHLQIELHGWDVLARDLGSRGGSVLTAPGRPPVTMRGGEAYLLEPGTVVDLAEVYQVRFETGVVAL